MKRYSVVVGMVLILLQLAQGSLVAASTCAKGESASGYLVNTDLIFIGEMRLEETVAEKKFVMFVTKPDSKHLLWGKLPGNRVLVQVVDNTFGFEKRKSYIVFANKMKGNPRVFTIASCSGTVPLDSAEGKARLDGLLYTLTQKKPSKKLK